MSWKNNFVKQAESAERAMAQMEEIHKDLHTSECVRVHDEWACALHCNVLEQLPWLSFVRAWDDKLLKPQVVKDGWWHVVSETNEDEQGYVSAGLFNEAQAIESICGEEPAKATLVEGWGARLSAPGYLDSSEWAVFETEKKAREYLMETYGEDD